MDNASLSATQSPPARKPVERTTHVSISRRHLAVMLDVLSQNFQRQRKPNSPRGAISIYCVLDVQARQTEHALKLPWFHHALSIPKFVTFQPPMTPAWYRMRNTRMRCTVDPPSAIMALPYSTSNPSATLLVSVGNLFRVDHGSNDIVPNALTLLVAAGRLWRPYLQPSHEVRRPV